MSDPKTVCVTGASGFIGTHVVRELLSRGHRVRATVRDAKDEGKTDHLRALEGASERLQIFSANLLDEGAFDEPVSGSDWVCHVAAAVTFGADDPQRDIVDPAVKGTANVLAAIDKAPSVKRVGLTSSVAAVGSTGRREGHTFTEDDWNDDATVDSNPYGLAKVTSERAVWSHREARPEGERYDLTVVNPSLVLGTADIRVHVRSSLSVIRDLMRGTFKGCPPLGFSVVDVRDVVEALLRGMETGRTGRYITSTRGYWMHELAEMIDRLHPELKVPTRKIPGFLLYPVALFDKRISFAYLRRNLNRVDQYSNQKAREELGIEFRDPEESVAVTCRSIIDHGWL